MLLFAVNYHGNSKVLLKDEVFYHIIIIRSKNFKKKLKVKKERINGKNLVNFTILWENNELEICG